MSRTRHHRGQRHRHNGEDLWGIESGNGTLGYCAYNKRLTRKRQSRLAKIRMEKEIKGEMH